MYIVASGHVKIFKTSPDRREQILRIMGRVTPSMKSLAGLALVS